MLAFWPTKFRRAKTSTETWQIYVKGIMVTMVTAVRGRCQVTCLAEVHWSILKCIPRNHQDTGGVAAAEVLGKWCRPCSRSRRTSRGISLHVGAFLRAPGSRLRVLGQQNPSLSMLHVDKGWLFLLVVVLCCCLVCRSHLNVHSWPAHWIEFLVVLKPWSEILAASSNFGRHVARHSIGPWPRNNSEAPRRSPSCCLLVFMG